MDLGILGLLPIYMAFKDDDEAASAVSINNLHRLCDLSISLYRLCTFHLCSRFNWKELARETSLSAMLNGIGFY